MLEFEIQNRFIEHITGQRHIKSPETNRLEVYRQLVFSRFEEVITKALPIFTEKAGKLRMKELIAGFIKSKPESPFIWQSPGEFIKYVENRNLVSDLSWGPDLLWYEWIEVELFMNCPRPGVSEKFDWTRRWKLSASAKIRHLNYRIYLDDFTEEGDFPVILYYTSPAEEVHYQEITPFLFDFFQFNSGETAHEALHRTGKLHNIIPRELDSLLYDTMQNYVDKKILEAV